MAVELALTSGAVEQTKRLIWFRQISLPSVVATLWAKQLDVANRKETGGGGVTFALAESHFEIDAAFQDLFI